MKTLLLEIICYYMFSPSVEGDFLYRLKIETEIEKLPLN